MADNRERARALREKLNGCLSYRTEPGRNVTLWIDVTASEEIIEAALDAAFSRGKEGALQKLHAELNKLRWIGADEGWELAIKAVREHIAASLPLPTSPEEPRGSASIADEATVERMARASYEVMPSMTYLDGPKHTWETLGDFMRDVYRVRARAARAALAAIPAPPAPLKDTDG